MQSVSIAESLPWKESQKFKTETFTMDGDDDLFAVFDADENAEDKPPKASPSGQVLLFLFAFCLHNDAHVRRTVQV